MRPLAKHAAVALALCLVPSIAESQSLTRTPIPATGVSGLELALEGATEGHGGAEVRWYLTLYEVVGPDRLRPATGGRVRVLSSSRPEAALADLRMDRYGRAEVAIPVPDDGTSSFEVALEASSGPHRRDFRMTVSVLDPVRVELFADRAGVAPGERVTFVGRALHLPSGRPVVGEAVRARVTDEAGRSLGPVRELRTGPAGAFLVDLGVPERVASLSVTVTVGEVATASASVPVAERRAPRMVVLATPAGRLLGPGERVEIDVEVRRADGRPVRAARVHLVGAGDETRRERTATTDASGRARVVFQAPRDASAAGIESIDLQLVASRAGLGEASTPVVLRVAREGHDVSLAVEGGCLVPGLGGAVTVRATGASGEPAARARLRLEGPLVGRLEATTDDQGVASFAVSTDPPAGLASRDRCGGATATAVTISLEAGGSEETFDRCLPLDPDGLLRLGPARLVAPAGEALDVELLVAPAAARAPIELALLRLGEDGRLAPVGRQILAPGARRARVTLPEDAPGPVLLRARPLVGASLDPVRGGSALVWATRGRPLAVQVATAGGAATITPSDQRPGVEGVLLVTPAAEAAGLEARARRLGLGELDAWLGDEAAARSPLVAGLLASRTPRDDAAPAVLRDGEAVVVAAPDSPGDHGVLRDPVRARARYVRGRLALVLRSLERQLGERIPEGIGDVGVEASGRWAWNREALDAIVGAYLLADQVPTTLGGEPLRLADLEALDRELTFDAMARRVTRERLLALLVALRQFVHDHDLDMWRSEGADPDLWLRLLVEDGTVAESALRDAWGRRMAIRRARGGRARFTFLAPLPPGWELLSAGPDGRFGTGDDVFDPFARVLRSGGAYAEAVAEDELLARLERVELGQATIDELARVFELEGAEDWSSSGLEAGGGFGAPPAPLGEAAGPRVFERDWLPMPRPRATLADLGAPRRVRLPGDDEPRSYGLVAVAFTPEGWVAAARGEARGGVPMVLASPPLYRLRVGEPLTLPVSVALLPPGQGPVRLEVEASGPLEAELDGAAGPTPVELGPGGGAVALVALRPTAAGRASIEVTATLDGGGSRSIRLALDLQEEGLRRVQAGAAAASVPVELALDLPRDARAAEGFLVLSTPAGLLGDPTLARWEAEDPALVAWALAVSGRDLPEELVRSLEAATERGGSVAGRLPALSGACATVAWASTTAGASWAADATASAAAASPLATDDAGGLALAAAEVAALSVAASPSADSPLGRAIAVRRDALRLAVRRHRGNAALLARGAAALLLVDPRDVRGRTMLTLARRRLERGFRGGRAIALSERPGSPEGREGLEQLVATAALAVAAHQTGEEELARELGQGLAARAHVATALGGEPLFWLLAARAFGVFGAEGTLAVVVEQGGARRRVELSEAATVLPIDLPRPGRRAAVRVVPEEGAAAAAFVQTEARYLRAERAVDRGPCRAALEGDPGEVGGRAAYVATIECRGGEPVSRPEVLVTLPAGSHLDPTGLAALAQAEGVLRVEAPDRRGVLRLALAPLAPSTPLRLPLPVVWTAAGRRAGPSLAVFPADRSWELAVTPPAPLDVALPEDW